MEFEFDERKSHANRVKHGIDFVEAQALWEDGNLLQVPARIDDEPRSMVIARIGNRCWSAVITERNGRIRIISVRRARSAEKEHYESQGIR